MKFYKETEFQDTSIGRVPSDWDAQELGDKSIANIIAGQSPPSSTYSKEKQGLPFLQGKTEFGDVFPSPTVYCSKPIKVAKRDDVLLSVRAPVGDVNIAPFECCIGRGLAAIRTEENMLSHMYLFHYLRLEGKRFEALSAGSTFKAIRMKEIEKFQVPLPPMPEQTAIVGVLGVVDSAIELADRVITQTERLKKGLMQQLLTRGIGHTEYKNTPIGKIPKPWQIVQVSTVGNVSTGKTPPTSNDKYWNGDVPFITPADMGNSKYVYETERHVTAEGAEQSNILPRNTVLTVCIGSTIGKVALSQKESITNQQINSIVCNREIAESQYVYYALFFRTHLLRSFSGVAAVPIIKKSLFEQFMISIPSLSEQRRIAEILSAIDCKLEVERTQKRIMERIKQGLMDLLLTGKVRIKVD